jgi:HPt (histidine-containing phosphotransfer) domain-containing protein
MRDIEKERGLERTPIIAMTAYAMQGDQEKCMTAGMDGYLSKPARPAEILESLDRLLPERREVVPAADQDRSTEVISETVHASVPETVPPTACLPVFDKQELLERLGGREEILGRFIDMFIRNVAGYLKSLETAVTNQDVEQVRIQAHTIKGAAANISARQIRETAAAMEAHARDGKLGEASVLLEQITNEISAFQSEVGAQY